MQPGLNLSGLLDAIESTCASCDAKNDIMYVKGSVGVYICGAVITYPINHALTGMLT